RRHRHGVRHLPHPPVRARHPRRAARRGAPRRRLRAAHLLDDRAAAAAPDPRHARRLHLPLVLERLHVAAHRAHRREQVHAAAGARQPLRRARAGHRADARRRRRHRAPRAAALPRRAAALHRGDPDGEREGVSARGARGEGMVRGAHPAGRRFVGGARRTMLLAGTALLVAAATPPVGSPTALLGVASDWQAAPANGVSMRIADERTPEGAPALRIDYDFQGHGGWAAARRTIALALPPRYELRFLLRGEGPPNNLEVKLVEPDGEDVWWHVDRARAWPSEWTPVRILQRQIAFAWGPHAPAAGAALDRIGALEITVSAAEGGRGTIWLANLELVAVPPLATTSAPLRATANASEPEHGAAAAVDGDARTSWRPGAGGGTITVDLGGRRELGGVSLAWERGGEGGLRTPPRRFTVELSADGDAWSTGRTVTQGGAAQGEVRLADAEARAVRVRVPAGECGDRGCGLAELSVRPVAFGETMNDFVSAVAAAAPRGAYPRGFREGVYWTVVGTAGDRQESLVSEDGVVESGERGWSLEPFLALEDAHGSRAESAPREPRLLTWADVTSTRALADGDLPLPTVTWTAPGSARLAVTA